MIVVKHNKKSGQISEVQYPRQTLAEKVEGLDDDIEFYFLQTEPFTSDEQFFIPVVKYQLTTQAHAEYQHLKICEKYFELVQKDNADIIEFLNSELGEYLDREYPIAIRIKHSDELILGTTPERETYIKNLKNWLNECRAIRHLYEQDLLSGNLPYLRDYPVKPLN